MTGEIPLSDDFKDLTMRMLAYNPDKRPTIEEIKKHPWMQGLYPQKAQIDIITKIRRDTTYKMNFKIDKCMPQTTKSTKRTVIDFSEANTMSSSISQKRI